MQIPLQARMPNPGVGLLDFCISVQARPFGFELVDAAKIQHIELQMLCR